MGNKNKVKIFLLRLRYQDIFLSSWLVFIHGTKNNIPHLFSLYNNGSIIIYTHTHTQTTQSNTHMDKIGLLLLLFETDVFVTTKQQQQQQ